MSVCIITGLIYEEACTKCGGKEGLTAALERGDIKKAEGEGGRAVYFFPKIEVGHCSSSSNNIQVTNQKAIDDDNFLKFKDQFQSLT